MSWTCQKFAFENNRT